MSNLARKCYYYPIEAYHVIMTMWLRDEIKGRPGDYFDQEKQAYINYINKLWC